MRNVLVIFLLGILTVLLSACGEDTTGDNNPNPDAPYFDSIGTPTVTAGETMNFTVVATDPNSMNVTLTYDGSLGPNMNPFTAGASFNTGTGEFNWVTDANDVGNYSVRFTATNDDVPPMETSVNVTLQVLAVANNNPTGETLYIQNCQSCHGVDGAGGPGAVFGVQCSAAITITEALNLSAMSGISLTAQEIQDIANFLQSFPNC